MTGADHPLSAAQAAAIRASFEALQPRVREASDLFYERLFTIAPDLRKLFRADLTGQGMRFMTALGEIVDHMDDPEALRPHLTRLAQGHAAYGVEPAHFKPMGEALIWTMRESLDGGLSAETAAAWEMAYDHLASEMIALARE